MFYNQIISMVSEFTTIKVYRSDVNKLNKYKTYKTEGLQEVVHRLLIYREGK